jgi:hypothetical protein
MDMKIRETYVNRTEHTQFGDSEWYEPWTDDKGTLFREFQREFGRCESKVYQDKRVSLPFSGFGVDVPAKYETVPVGWVFAKRMRYEDARFTNRDDFYIREVWVEVDGS